MDRNLKEMISINEKQKAFYEIKKKSNIQGDRNLISSCWAVIRDRFHHLGADFGMYEHLYVLHRNWVEAYQNPIILDLGSHSGNPLSIELAEHAKEYLAIDLSESAIQILDKKLRDKKLNHANAISVDFLSKQFQQQNAGKYDIIYAHSVAHHFKYFELFLEHLSNCLAPGGIVITFDPLQTSLPSKIFRMLYRPFQSDASWEYPFNRQSFRSIQQHFDVAEVCGFLGLAKLAIPIYLIHKKWGTRLGKHLFKKDQIASRKIGFGLFRCMHTTMYWKKKS